MADVIETPVETPVAATPMDTTPVDTGTPAVDPAIPAPADAAAIDPNDPFAALNAAMKETLGDEPAPDPAATPDPNAVPASFQNALQISDFVKSPEHVEQAVRAADEVWKVANGQQPASSLLEGMRAANPQGFEAVINNLVPYIEQITGQKFGADPNAQVDPREARLSAIEQRFQQEQQQRDAQQYQQQVGAAREVATKYLTDALKGTFAEGQEAFVLAQCASKVGVPEQQMVQQLLSGNTKPLEAAMRAVQREETARLKAYNANLVKQYHTKKNSVPATKGNAVAPGTPKSTDYRPGETAIQHATRLFNEGL